MDDDFFSAPSGGPTVTTPAQGNDDDFFGGNDAPISPAGGSGGAPQVSTGGGDDDFFGGNDAPISPAGGSANAGLPTQGSGISGGSGGFDDDFGVPPQQPQQQQQQEEEPAIEEVEDEEPARQPSAAAGSAASFGFDAEPTRPPELEVDAVESPQGQGSSHSLQAGGSSASLGQPAASPTAQSPASPNPMDGPIPDAKKAELSPVDKWNVEMRQDMINRDQQANQKRDDMKKEAQKALDEFYSQRKQLIESNQQRNVQAEQEFCKSRDELFAHGGVWERVASLVDLKASTDKKQSRTARMKSLLLLMKNEKQQS